jgi:hypothetical protein
MSAYHDIFLRPHTRDHDLVTDVSVALGVASGHLPGVEGAVFETETAFIDVFNSHDMETDGDLPFADYPEQITVRDRDRDKDRSERTAQEIGHKLVATDRYNLFIVYDTTQLVSTQL